MFHNNGKNDYVYSKVHWSLIIYNRWKKCHTNNAVFLYYTYAVEIGTDKTDSKSNMSFDLIQPYEDQKCN